MRFLIRGRSIGEMRGMVGYACGSYVGLSDVANIRFEHRHLFGVVWSGGRLALGITPLEYQISERRNVQCIPKKVSLIS